MPRSPIIIRRTRRPPLGAMRRHSASADAGAGSPAAPPRRPLLRTSTSRPSLRARLYLLVTAVLFSTGGAAVKACSFTSWQVAGLRSTFAVVALLLVVPATRARWTLPVVVVGISQATTMLLFVSATKLTTAANAIFLQSTAPLYVLLLAPILLREPVRRIDMMFLGAFLLGLSVIFL